MTITGPTMFYHRTKPPVIVRTLGQYQALGPGWADTPAAFYAADPPAPAPEPEPEPAVPAPERPRAARRQGQTWRRSKA